MAGLLDGWEGRRGPTQRVRPLAYTLSSMLLCFSVPLCRVPAPVTTDRHAPYTHHLPSHPLRPPQFNLFGGTVLKLGTKRHHDLLLRGITSLDDIGCFALTELGFGE